MQRQPYPVNRGTPPAPRPLPVQPPPYDTEMELIIIEKKQRNTLIILIIFLINGLKTLYAVTHTQAIIMKTTKSPQVGYPLASSVHI